MSITALRSAILLAGGTPVYYTHVELLQQLITTWGGTPTQKSINGLLKEAITTAGGTATQVTQLGLLSELVTTLGGNPASCIADELWALLAILPFGGGGLFLMEDGTSKVLMEDGTSKIKTEAGGGGGGPAPDTTPDAFILGNRTSSPTSTVVQAPNTVTVSGINSPTTATLSGDASSQGRVNGGAWGAGPWTVNNGDQIDVRHTSSGTGNTLVTSTLTIGGVAANFSSTTVAIVQLTTTAVTHAEGNSGSTNFSYTLTRVGDLSVAASVNWAVTGSGGNPANAADFALGILPTGVANFNIGDATATISIDVAGDTTVESDEAFTLTLSSPANMVFGAQTTATGTITNDDSLPVPAISFSTATVSHPEGNSGTTTYSYTVTRSGDLSGASSADWAVTGTGLNPANAADFVGGVLPSGTVSFASGDSSKTITINVQGDTTTEVDEAFLITLSNPSNATLGATTATGDIIDDDNTSAINLESLPGLVPLILSYTSATAPAGTLLYIEFANSLTPATNADGSFTTPSQQFIKFVTGEDYANLYGAVGYATPSGDFSVHAQELLDDGVGTTSRTDQFGTTGTYTARAFSNTVTGTTTASTAQLSTSVGDQSQYIDVSSDGFTATHNNPSVGLPSGVRADQGPLHTKWWAAITVKDMRNPSGSIWFGMSDLALDLDTPGTVNPLPGQSGNQLGWTIRCVLGATSVNLYRNGNGGSQTASFTGGVAIADNDIFYIEEDEGADTFTVKFIPAATGVAQTLFSNQAFGASYTPTNPRLTVYAARGDGTPDPNASDTLFVNFGQASPPVTPTATYDYYA